MQNVGAPRFYINDLTWGQSIGIKKQLSGNGVYMNGLLIDGNPNNPATWTHTLTSTVEGASVLSRFHRPDYYKPNYYAILGHNLASQGVGMRHSYRYDNGDGEGNWGFVGGYENIINSPGKPWADVNGDTFNFPEFDGFSICGLTGSSKEDEHHAFQFTMGYGGEGTYVGQEYNVKIGTIFHGRYYDVPLSPDLKLTMTREMDGVKRIRTKGGNDLVDHKYTKKPMWDMGRRVLQQSDYQLMLDSISSWGEMDFQQTPFPADWFTGLEYGYYTLNELYEIWAEIVGLEELFDTPLPPWELSKKDTSILGTENPLGHTRLLAESGRKIWDLSFTLMDVDGGYKTGQLFPAISNLSYVAATTSTGESVAGSSGFEDDPPQDQYGLMYQTDNHKSFYANVVHKTNGGQLPFIFQPDRKVPLNFALCKFDMKSFKFTQTSNNVYSVKMKIREVW